MAYLSPSIAASGTTFAQFRSGGFQGQLIRLANANAFPPAVRSLILSSPGDIKTGIVHVLDAFLRGDPITTADINARLLTYATALRAITAALEEANVLVDANPGTLATVRASTAAGHKTQRNFP